LVQSLGEFMRSRIHILVLAAASLIVPTAFGANEDTRVAKACLELSENGLRDLAADRTSRFLGKVENYRAECRGGDRAVQRMPVPWVDWSNYWATGNSSSQATKHAGGGPIFNRNLRGIDGALVDLEYQRMELIKFNLFDNNKTFQTYLGGGIVNGRRVDGATLRVWPEMRLPSDHPNYRDLEIQTNGAQLCNGSLIRFRTLSGICNDPRNPAMGSVGQLFGRNVEFESTFPDLALNSYAKNRHGSRIGLLQPDPQLISRKLFTRDQSTAPNCNEGRGAAGRDDAECAYKKAPFFNVLAAFWIQFMTHDWFSHLNEGRNDEPRMLTDLGCATDEGVRLGCRKEDKIDAALIAESDAPGTFPYEGVDRFKRSAKTSRNNTTAWWDASQIYGYDQRSQERAKRDPADPAKLLLVAGASPAERPGYLPTFRSPCLPGAAPGVAEDNCDPIRPEWQGQEAVAFPDNWTIGLSFFHNLFAREHNNFVDEFRKAARARPRADSGLRNPDRPRQPIAYGDITADELFEIARLAVAAEIAKIHTIEWTTQLLYDEPLHIGMNSNWSGLLATYPLMRQASKNIVSYLARSPSAKQANQIYSALAAAPGIIGLPSGPHHFGSPFNFPEEFVTVYRLHPLVPDLLEFRDWQADPNKIRRRIPVIDTFRGKATTAMHNGGLANWALTMGRQRLGALALQNHPQFLQNIDLRPRVDSKIDLAALDIIRDREHGLPRFNEFRRQIGLRQLTGFDDFLNRVLPEGKELTEQRDIVKAIREVYGQHRCDASKIITTAQLDQQRHAINDCLGHGDGTMVDNIEDVDIVVGFLAETTRPHGFAISETQFQIFILNASRRLFSDRFFTADFRPAFYTQFGIDWVTNNGPAGKQWEDRKSNGRREEILPLKRVLLRNIPELQPELKNIVNSFDPWARDRGQYYTLDWNPRLDAAKDPAFARP
jgi:hypothetical protein